LSEPHEQKAAFKDKNLLEKQFGEHVAEQRGWHWSLTSFASDNLGGNDKNDAEIVN
jgi:hypothetical protein